MTKTKSEYIREYFAAFFARFYKKFFIADGFAFAYRRMDDLITIFE